MSDYPTITAQDVRGGQIRPEDILLARRVKMNMMSMATMEEAIEEAWSKWPLPPRLRADAFVIYGDGFRAGVAWSMRQAEIEASSQAVGNMSQYPGEAEEPEEEA